MTDTNDENSDIAAAPAAAGSAPPALTRLVLIRHGEANCNVEEFIGGAKSCTGLSPRGREQAARLRERLERTGELAGADVLLASLLPRAIETAEILAPALGDLEIETDCDLCEMHPGECDGMKWTEFEETYGFDIDNDAHHPFSPGGETVAEFYFRVVRTLHRVVREHAGKTVVVATHGGVVDGSVIGLLGVPVQQPPRGALVTANTSLTEWAHRPSAGSGLSPWRLVRYNDASHLLEGA